MANAENQISGKNERYNPNSETKDLDQVIASNWELLRRAPAFQAVARQWAENEKFRIKHVSEKKAYADNPYARCALDWMLTPEQRYALAQFQMQNRLFFWRPENNYGPITVQPQLECLTGGIKQGIDGLFAVNPDLNPGGILQFGQSWPTTPAKFRAQFSSIFDGGDLKEIVLDENAQILQRVGSRLTEGNQISAEEQLELGRFLFQLGDHFHHLGQDYKIAAIRRHQFFSEKLLDEILQTIKKSFPYQPTTGHDHHARRSFLGTPEQWDKFLAWEAHSGNAYRAAAEFLPKAPDSSQKTKRRPGDLSRSERQRDAASSIRQAVRAIEKWYPKIYPVRNLDPNSLRLPKAD